MSFSLCKLWWTAMLVTCLAGGVHAASTVNLAAPAGWVESSPAPELSPTPAADTSYGYDYLLLERQTNVREQSVYFRNVYRLTLDSALQNGASFTWSYDPEYEQLTLHHLRVIRNGEVQERLREGLVKTIQQERDLDRHMLNGHLTALVLLDDIRVGDVIDYAFTRTGWNPTFAGRYFDYFSARWSVPVRHQRVQLTGLDRRVFLRRAHGGVTHQWKESQRDGERVLTWDLRDVRPLAVESEIPGWFRPYPFLQISEFATWSEVVAWAVPLYALPATPDPAVVAQAEKLTKGLTNEAEKAIALLQFVQQEIRYLGMELGAGSYRPSPPAEVLARRFGDCKDKTLLFCALMRAVGLTAYPALLHTDYRRTVEDWLPSPHAFDHVIACIPSGGKYAWVDPTLTEQKGRLSARSVPDYGRALVVKPGNRELSTVEVPAHAAPTVRIEEVFDIKAFDQPAQLTVTTHFTGSRADGMRRYLAQTTPEEIQKAYVNYYASAYPGLSSTGFHWSEQEPLNELTTVEEYTVPDLWSKPDEAGMMRAEFFPKNISDYTTRPTTTVRTMPLAIAHPVDIRQRTTVNLPEDWTVTAKTTEIEDHAFRATRGIAGKGPQVVMTHGWQSLADHVPVDKVAGHVASLNRYRESLGYSLTYTKASADAPDASADSASEAAFRLNWSMAFVGLSLLAGAVYVSAVIVRRAPSAPPPLAPNPALVGLGGWLALVAIGVVLRPCVLTWELVSANGSWFNQRVWDAVAVPGAAGYQKYFGALLVFEVAGNILQMVASLLQVVLFFRRHHAFPAVFIAQAGFTVFFLSFDIWAAGALLTNVEHSGIAEVGRAAMQAAVWIPYMLVSRRVKATFTN